MPHGIDKIGSVPEKSFEKSKQFEFKEKDQSFQTEQQADKFSSLLDGNKNEQLTKGVNANDLPFNKGNENVGDKILNAFQGAKDIIDNKAESVGKTLTSDEMMSMKDMLKVQSTMANLTLTQDLMGKVVGKATQSFETLMKQQ